MCWNCHRRSPKLAEVRCGSSAPSLKGDRTAILNVLHDGRPILPSSLQARRGGGRGLHARFPRLRILLKGTFSCPILRLSFLR
jgi:hypothetical protein